MTRPLTLRAARPNVWIRDVVGAQKALLVRVEDGDQGDLGQVEALAEEVDPDEDVEVALAQVAEDLDPVERLDLGVEVADAQSELVVVAGQVLGHLLGQGRDESPLVRLRPGSRSPSSRSSTWPWTGRISISGSIRPVGRMTCSTTRPCVFSSSYAPGVAET